MEMKAPVCKAICMRKSTNIMGRLVWGGVQKRVNITGLRLLCLGLHARLVGPWLVSGNLASKQFPTLI